MSENFEEFEEDLAISELEADAIHMHEFFSALRRAGFSEQQALILVSLFGAPDSTLVVSEDDDEE
jgi:hypothetical protein